MKKILLFCVAILLACAGTGYADFYTWEDESGVSHISDQPPPVSIKSKNMRVYQRGEANENEKAAPAEKKAPDIVLYTKTDCPDCEKAREYLTSRKLVFTEHNIDIDEAAKEKRKVIDGMEDVPFAVIGRTQVYGFSEAIFDRALKMAP